MIIEFIGVFCLGFLFSNLINKAIIRFEDNKISKKVNLVYTKLLNNIYEKKTKFISRINNTISIDTSIEGEKLNIMYMMDRRDIAIFSKDSCIYTSHLVNSELLNKIITAIEISHNDKINDVVSMMGITFSREDFERKFNVKIEDLKNSQYMPIELSDIDTIINENETKYNIDYILDRISEVGIDNLNDDERDFLNKYK